MIKDGHFIHNLFLSCFYSFLHSRVVYTHPLMTRHSYYTSLFYIIHNKLAKERSASLLWPTSKSPLYSSLLKNDVRGEQKKYAVGGSIRDQGNHGGGRPKGLLFWIQFRPKTRAMKINAIWDVTSCSMARFFQCFEGTCCSYILPCRWKQEVPPKYLLCPTTSCTVTIFIITTEGTLNLI
jgi:hypothetical protein